MSWLDGFEILVEDFELRAVALGGYYLVEKSLERLKA